MEKSAPPRTPRADARRNQRALLDAASEVFADRGVEAPVREIADRAGVGVGTIYRHFPTRGDLVASVYRHQIDELAADGEALLETGDDAADALERWADAFVDFLGTKHGLAATLDQNDPARAGLHTLLVDRLVPPCDRLLGAAREGAPASVSGYALLRGIGNLCIGSADPRYDARALARLLVRAAVADALEK